MISYEVPNNYINYDWNWTLHKTPRNLAKTKKRPRNIANIIIICKNATVWPVYHWREI